MWSDEELPKSVLWIGPSAQSFAKPPRTSCVKCEKIEKLSQSMTRAMIEIINLWVA
jgi:hypothetical protein